MEMKIYLGLECPKFHVSAHLDVNKITAYLQSKDNFL